MVNHCDIIITRGKNQGKKCSAINKICRHCNRRCPCGTAFTIDTSYSRHISECPIHKEQKNHVKTKINITKRKSHPVTIAKQATPEIDNMSQLLMEKIKQLEAGLEEVKNKPTTVNNWNIVINQNFYTELVGLMGKDAAVSFLTSTAAKNKPIDIISKLYLNERKPDEYPIACRRGDHFRYINDQYEVVDDKGGNNIGQIVSNQIQNAYILASNEIILQQIQTSGTPDECDLAMLQKKLSNTDIRSRRQVLKDLATVTNNPDHPFFKCI